jgi:hypothetical protein
MGLLSTTTTLPDARLTPGAYIRQGVTLYRVAHISPSQVILEDAFRSNQDCHSTQATTAADITKNYVLVRTAHDPAAEHPTE